MSSSFDPRPGPVIASQPRSYPQLLRGPRYRWWRGLASIAMGAGLFVVVQVIAGIAILTYLIATDTELEQMMSRSALTEKLMSDPWMFLANNLTLAALIPVAGLTIWACHGWRPRWVSSVVPRLRWGFMLACAVIAAIAFAGYLLVGVALGGLPDLSGGENVALLLVIVALTTPFQAAGEEYFFRGLLTQSIASWFARPMAAFVASALSTALLFAAVHSLGGEQNFWLFFARFAIGLVASYLAWRTGGLEAGIALHTVNNMVGMVLAILAGGLAEALSNPEQSAASALVQMIPILLATGGIVALARAMGIQRVHDPDAQPGGYDPRLVTGQPPAWGGHPGQPDGIPSQPVGRDHAQGAHHPDGKSLW